MNHKQGYISKKIDGVIRHFHFSINAWLLLCEIHEIGLSEIGSFLNEPKNQGVASRDLLYCAALAYCREKEIDEDFNRYDAGIWYDELSIKDYQEIEKVMLNCNFLKGSKKKR